MVNWPILGLHTLNLNTFSSTTLIFDLKVLRVRELEPAGPIRGFLKFTTNFKIFKRNLVFARHFIEYNYFFSEVLL